MQDEVFVHNLAKEVLHIWMLQARVVTILKCIPHSPHQRASEKVGNKKVVARNSRQGRSGYSTEKVPLKSPHDPMV